VNHARLVIVVTNYKFGSSFTNCLLHLEGEEVFGSAKQPANSCPLGTNIDSHHPNRANFFHPQVIIPDLVPNNVKDVHMQQPPSSP